MTHSVAREAFGVYAAHEAAGRRLIAKRESLNLDCLACAHEILRHACDQADGLYLLHGHTPSTLDQMRAIESDARMQADGIAGDLILKEAAVHPRFHHRQMCERSRF